MKEITKLLAERARQRQPERERMQRQLAKVEQVIANIMTAIKAGILTPTTKAELEKVEAERARLQDAIKTTAVKADKVVTMLPRVKERYQALIANLETVTLSRVEEARAQLKELLGEIVLKPTGHGFLEATMAGRATGLAKLAVGLRLNNELSPKVNRRGGGARFTLRAPRAF